MRRHSPQVPVWIFPGTSGCLLHSLYLVGHLLLTWMSPSITCMGPTLLYSVFFFFQQCPQSREASPLTPACFLLHYPSLKLDPGLLVWLPSPSEHKCQPCEDRTCPSWWVNPKFSPPYFIHKNSFKSLFTMLGPGNEVLSSPRGAVGHLK